MSPPTVVLVGTLDTKGEEYAFLRDRLELAGVATLLVDVGTQHQGMGVEKRGPVPGGENGDLSREPDRRVPGRSR